jgi:hypothetical protein
MRLAYALIIPLLIACLSSQSFLYDPPGHLDSNIYLGYFLHYSDHLPVFEGYYKSGRLPWVLPGFIAYRVLGPVTASVVLPIATMMLVLVCLYLLIRDALDARTALLGVVLLGACTWFHGVGGWNYHMTAATGYYLAIVLCLNKAAPSPTPMRWYLASGIALALALHTFIFIAAFVPGLVVHSLLISPRDRRTVRLVMLAALSTVVGAVLTTVVLGAINRATGGRFLFFMPVVEIALWLAKKNLWYQPPSIWLPRATYLTLPVAALVSCPLTWVFREPPPMKEAPSRTWMIAGFQVQLVWAVLICCYYQVVKHQTTLDYDYFGVVLLGPAVLSLCGFLYSVRSAWAKWSVHRIFAVAVAAIVGPFVVAGHCNWLPGWTGIPVVVPGVLACAGIVCLGAGRRRVAGLVTGLLLLGLANVESRQQPKGSLYRDAFLFNIEADQFSAGFDPTLTDIKYWFDAKGTAPWPHVFDSYVSTRVRDCNMVGGAPPVPLPELQAKHIGSSTQIAVLASTTEKEKQCRSITDRFASLGMPLEFRAERDFHHGEIEVSMTVYRILKPPRP